MLVCYFTPLYLFYHNVSKKHFNIELKVISFKKKKIVLTLSH